MKRQSINSIATRGLRQAKRITKRWAKTFYFAGHFLPREKRLAAYAVYAICRISDESVDGRAGGNNPAERVRQVQEHIRIAYLDNALEDPLLAALRQTVRKYAIPEHYFEELISGMRMDLEISRYPLFDKLYGYCYKVAGVVGLIMLCILEEKSRSAEKYAVDLGIAMQLTNILRDIKEDYQRGRIYLPTDEMLRLGVRQEDIAQGLVNANFKQLMRFQIARARSFYASSLEGIALIQDPRCRFVVRAMNHLYAEILASIEKNCYDVFTRRARVSLPQKVRILTRMLLKGKT